MAKLIYLYLSIHWAILKHMFSDYMLANGEDDTKSLIQLINVRFFSQLYIR